MSSDKSVPLIYKYSHTSCHESMKSGSDSRLILKKINVCLKFYLIHGFKNVSTFSIRTLFKKIWRTRKGFTHPGQMNHVIYVTIIVEVW